MKFIFSFKWNLSNNLKIPSERNEAKSRILDFLLTRKAIDTTVKDVAGHETKLLIYK